MPTYGFRCPEGHEFDRFYKTMSNAPSTLECPECGKSGERQLHGGAGLMFKGSGFYLTDYGKNAHRGAKPAAAGDGGSAKPDAAKADASKAETAKPKADAPAPKAESAKPTSKTPKSE